MTTPRRQQTSLDAYLALMQNKGADAANLARRRALLEKLLPLLADKSDHGDDYRNAVDAALPLIDKSEWPFFMTVVRDFYYFWTNDFKAIAALHKGGAFDATPQLPPPPQGTLKDLWHQLDTEKFEISEKWPVNAYKAALRDEGIPKEAIEVRVRMAQLLLLQLRKMADREDKTGQTYRIAAESMLPVFLKKETSELFIGVVREFFHFWMGDPNAAENLGSGIVVEHLDDQNSLW